MSVAHRVVMELQETARILRKDAGRMDDAIEIIRALEDEEVLNERLTRIQTAKQSAANCIMKFTQKEK